VSQAVSPKLPALPVVLCPGCNHCMRPRERKPVHSSHRLMDVVYVCEKCGTETRRAIRKR